VATAHMHNTTQRIAVVSLMSKSGHVCANTLPEHACIMKKNASLVQCGCAGLTLESEVHSDPDIHTPPYLGQIYKKHVHARNCKCACMPAWAC
jgi:hypothetical protein